MGIDPGVRNFAIIALDERERVFFARMLHSTISSMSMHMAHQRPQFRSVMSRILDHVAPHELMIETFVARGFGTTLTEFVNLMIGGIMVMCDQRNIEEHATMASSWKNDAGRHYRGPDYVPPRVQGGKKASSTLGRAATGHLYALAEKLDVPPHLVDALMLGTYLRHGKSMERVDWSRVRENIRTIARIMPHRDRLSESKSRKKPRKRGRKSSATGGRDHSHVERGAGGKKAQRKKPARGARLAPVGKHAARDRGRAAARSRPAGRATGPHRASPRER